MADSPVLGRLRESAAPILRRPVRSATLALIVLGLALLPFIWTRIQPAAVAGPGLGGPAAYLWGAVWAAALGLLLFVLPFHRTEKPVILVLWAAKVTVTLGLMVFYEAHYAGSLDAFGYYLRGSSPTFVWHGLQTTGGVDNIDTLVWGMHWLVPHSYHAVKITFSFIGLLGIYTYYRTAKIVWPSSGVGTLVLLGLFPSILFWSSILGKDPLTLMGLALACLGAAQLHLRRRIWPLAFVAGALILLLVRPWIVPMVVLPTVIVAAAAKWGGKTEKSRAAWTAKLIAIGGGLTVLALMLASSTSLMGEFLARLNSRSRAWAEGGSGQLPPTFDSIWVVLVFLPWGAFTALFRPLPGEIVSAYGLFAGLENLALLGAIFLVVRRRHLRRCVEAPILWGLLFMAFWASIYAFLSYQNLGTAFRFRMQVLPVGILIMWRLWQPGNRQDEEPSVS